MAEVPATASTEPRGDGKKPRSHRLHTLPRSTFFIGENLFEGVDHYPCGFGPVIDVAPRASVPLVDHAFVLLGALIHSASIYLIPLGIHLSLT